MPARLIPADKLTHIVVGVLVALALLPFGWEVALQVCLLAAIGREIYAWRTRGWTMTRADAIEHAVDILCTLAGGGAVFAAAFIGVCSD